jgi:hypothetical protein
MSARRRLARSAVAAGCLLCSGPPAAVGVWVPTVTASARLGAAAGRTRPVTYQLCRKCAVRPGATARVEAKLFAEAVERN